MIIPTSEILNKYQNLYKLIFKTRLKLLMGKLLQ